MVAFVNRPEDSIGPAPAHDAASWPQCCSECGQAALREVGTCPVIGGRQEKLLEISQRPHLLPCRSRPAIRHQSHLHLRRRHHHHTGIFDPGGRCPNSTTHFHNTSPGVRIPCAAASRASCLPSTPGSSALSSPDDILEKMVYALTRTSRPQREGFTTRPRRSRTRLGSRHGCENGC